LKAHGGVAGELNGGRMGKHDARLQLQAALLRCRQKQRSGRKAGSLEPQRRVPDEPARLGGEVPSARYPRGQHANRIRSPILDRSRCALEQAYRRLEELVRKRCGFNGVNDHGAKVFSKAFGHDKWPLVWRVNDEDSISYAPLFTAIFSGSGTRGLIATPD
jgi:hypothetical protein